ncbi:MAG: T9SS type A sorting domain-containing protein [Bacteroidetes bacterium]|nr:T9SS type A sorting domain-containing protein [Bacteroidota bacterium]
MKLLYTTISLFIFWGLLSDSFAQCNVNTLTNPDFETPVQSSIGNNLTGLYSISGWTMNGGPFNIVKTDGSAYPSGPDTASSGVQYVDITNAAGSIYQDFTVTSLTAVAFGGAFSSRESDPNYIPWLASVQIYAMPSNTLVAISSTKTFMPADGAVPAQDVWYYLFGNTTLAPGQYRFIASLGDFGNFDNAFVFQNCALPVVLTSFSGTYKNSSVGLNWDINRSINFSHFEVEKSNDGISFLKVALVNYINGKNQYQFIDDNATKGSNLFYRLKLEDNDGRYTYSNIIKIQTGTLPSWIISPNPVRDFLTINGLSGNGEIRILDLAGKMLHKVNTTSQSASMNVSFLSKGIYLVQYYDGEKMQSKKMVKE